MQYTSSSENYSSSIGGSPSKWNNKDKKGYVYKKSSYQFSNSGDSSTAFMDKSSNKNIEQLDALLEDLKNERQITREKDLLHSSKYSRTIDQLPDETDGTFTTTTRVVKSSKKIGKNEALDDIEHYSTADRRYLKSNGHNSFQDTVALDKYQVKGNVYEIGKSVPLDIYENKSTNQSVELVHPKTTATFENNLHNIGLSEDILPLPGTKVTTTVHTYTYEVPANRIQSQSVLNTTKHNVNEDLTLSQSHPLPAGPDTVVYNTESYSTINKSNKGPVVSNRVYEIREHRETNDMQQNLRQQPLYLPTESTNTSYNINTTLNTGSIPEPNNIPITSAHTLSPSPVEPTSNRYFYKESSNIVKTIHRPNLYHDQRDLMPLQQKPSSPNYTVHDDRYPPQVPLTSTVNYSSYSSSKATSRHGPNYNTSPTNTGAAPFPIDGVDYPGPPQKVDDLMQSFGNADKLDRSDIEPTLRKREIETSIATPSQENIGTVNRAGKEVYYPPGHEMMLTKREQMAAGSAAGGRWAKGSGNYEYESGYKSKTKTKSGGAMVPVCLPLCCAMPCSIM